MPRHLKNSTAPWFYIWYLNGHSEGLMPKSSKVLTIITVCVLVGEVIGMWVFVECLNTGLLLNRYKYDVAGSAALCSHKGK
jgi:hypothetical protein